MQVRPFPFDLLRIAMLLSAFLSIIAGASLMSQQAPVAASVAAAPSSSTAALAANAAPRASVLFERPESAPGTIAAAQEASTTAAAEGESHVFVISTLALVLGIIIIVLLIAD